MSVPRGLGTIALVLAAMAATPAAAQPPAEWRLADPLPSISSLDVPPLDIAGGSSEPDLATLGQRLSLRYFDVGINVAPRRPWLTRLTDGDGALTGTGRSRLGEFGVSTTDIGLDLRLRWPSTSTSGEPSASALQPYLSLGPALAVPIGEDPLGTAATRTDPGVSLGVRGAVGLQWQLAPGTSFFGEYRLGQERGRPGRTTTDSTLDLLYGLSIRF